MRLGSVVLAIVAASLVTRALPAQADSATWWPDAAKKDIAAARETMNTKFITAMNAPGAQWERTCR